WRRCRKRALWARRRFRSSACRCLAFIPDSRRWPRRHSSRLCSSPFIVPNRPCNQPGRNYRETSATDRVLYCDAARGVPGRRNRPRDLRGRSSKRLAADRNLDQAARGERLESSPREGRRGLLRGLWARREGPARRGVFPSEDARARSHQAALNDPLPTTAMQVRVWDPVVRLCHWSLLAVVALAWSTRHGGGAWHEWFGH